MNMVSISRYKWENAKGNISLTYRLIQEYFAPRSKVEFAVWLDGETLVWNDGERAYTIKAKSIGKRYVQAGVDEVYVITP